MFRKGRKFDGQVFLSYAIWYGAGRTVIEGLRTDSLYLFGSGLRISQLVGILSVIGAVVLYVIFLKMGKPVTPPIVKNSKKNTEEEISAEGEHDGSNQD